MEKKKKELVIKERKSLLPNFDFFLNI